MKNLKLILACAAFCIAGIMPAQNPVSVSYAVNINATQYLAITKNGIIDSANEVDILINILTAPPSSVRPETFTWLTNHNKNFENGKTALVIIQHPISIKALNAPVSTLLDSINKIYTKLMIEKRMTDTCLYFAQKELQDPNSEYATSIIDRIRFYQETSDRIDSALALVKETWKKLQPSFIEGKETVTYIHHYDPYAIAGEEKNTEYLIGKNTDILYLIIGGASNIALGTFSLSQKTDPSAVDINQAIALISSFVAPQSIFTNAIINPAKPITKSLTQDEINRNNAKGRRQTIRWESPHEMNEPVSLFYDSLAEAEKRRLIVAHTDPFNKAEFDAIVKMSKEIKLLAKGSTPSIKSTIVSFKPNLLKRNETINLSVPGVDKSFSVSKHTLKFFSIRAGIFGSSIDRKLFQLDDSSRLYIQNDTLRNKKFWANGFLVLEIYPFRGRTGAFLNDPDRLGPVWHPNAQVPWYYSRFGFFGGCRLSLHPQDAFVAGLSFNLTDAVHLHIGCLWYHMADNQNGLKVSPLGDEAYWKENAPATYKPYFTFGISLSPSSFTSYF